MGFSFCRNFLPPYFFGYCPRVEIQPLDGFITQWVFFLFTTTTFKDLVYGQSSSYRQRLRVSSYRGFFLSYHGPDQPKRTNKVGVSYQTIPMGTITYTHSPRTGVDSSKTYPRVRIFGYSPRIGTRSKCLQNPWGVTLTIESNHQRRLQNAVGFSFFTTTNKQILMGTTYTGLILDRP